ncbi:beta-lactamase domain protein [Thermodesulfobacterium geofontis OPF15]|jgi:ribonuclease BN (tRNA processing enzyme)|uniref:Beta-lactamase domain protein n=1 Tax=Thermodesulfobacterium geofontis (strain OPF15) TaxID=795359 RepID=F8C3R9_THEGP|nr:ribonuclease Z [Thermodesulfobacterium geofontis]AEH23636.1 beta-lactamase domain protein [Thermodesulfobacterium geofontis OPF15]
MKIFVLGSGTGWIRLDRNSPGYLVEVDDFSLLLDLGPGILRQILKIGKKLEDISAIFISHFHPDHVTDLIPFLFATRYSLGYKRILPISLYVSEDFSQFYNTLKIAFRDWIEPPRELLNINLLPKQKKYRFSIGPFKAYTTPVKHNPESLAIRLEYEGRSLVYSGDTGYCEELIELSEEADLLIIECSNSKEFYVEHHLSPEDIALISERAKVRRLILSHFYPHSENVDLDIIKERFKGEIYLAKDFMEIEI